MAYPPEDGHPSQHTNRARRGLTSFMRRTPLTTTPRRQKNPLNEAACDESGTGHIFYFFSGYARRIHADDPGQIYKISYDNLTII